MNIFIYTDESGVFDKQHNDFFVFGGVMFLSKEDKDNAHHKYLHAENSLKYKYNIKELKACKIQNKDKGKLFRSLNNLIKFGVVVPQERVLDSVFKNKKSKQRFLDYTYKRMIKEILLQLEKELIIKLEEIKNIYIYCDEHTTSTNGKYELREGLEQELKTGTHNWNFKKFYRPICENIESLNLKFCDSKNVALIRGADIVANRLYHFAITHNLEEIRKKIRFFEYRKDYN